jgi:hypothetical protein
VHATTRKHVGGPAGLVDGAFRGWVEHENGILWQLWRSDASCVQLQPGGLEAVRVDPLVRHEKHVCKALRAELFGARQPVGSVAGEDHDDIDGLRRFTCDQQVAGVDEPDGERQEPATNKQRSPAD